MLKKILIGIGVIIVLILAVAAFQPSEFKVSRSAIINAAPADIFPKVNNFRAWEEWSPWEKVDPNAQKTFEGPEEGEGASYSWRGNNDIGVGKMVIAQSLQPEKVIIHMEFLEPMPGTSTVEFEFKPVEAGTSVTWTMMGKNNYVGRLMCMFMNMDKMIGGQFEKGLAQLKSIVEPKS